MANKKEKSALFSIFRSEGSKLPDMDYDIDEITKCIVDVTNDESLAELPEDARLFELFTILLSGCIKSLSPKIGSPEEYLIGLAAARLAGNLGIIENSNEIARVKALDLEPNIGSEMDRLVSSHMMKDGTLVTDISPNIGNVISDDDVSEDPIAQRQYALEVLACSIASVAGYLVKSGESDVKVVSTLMEFIGEYLADEIPGISVSTINEKPKKPGSDTPDIPGKKKDILPS